MNRFAVPCAVLLGGIVTLLACSGAEKQDVLSSQIGSSSTSTSSGATSTSSTSSTSSSGTTVPPPPPTGECQQEEERNDTLATANEFTSSICGSLSKNDRVDYIRFIVPPTGLRFGYEGGVRLFFTGAGAIEQEYRPGGKLDLSPGPWTVRIERDGGGGNDGETEWRFNITF